MKCDQCQALMINGIFCHETGCPNSQKIWRSDREQWIRYVKCWNCECLVEEGESCDCQEIDESEE